MKDQEQKGSKDVLREGAELDPKIQRANFNQMYDIVRIKRNHSGDRVEDDQRGSQEISQAIAYIQQRSDVIL